MPSFRSVLTRAALLAAPALVAACAEGSSIDDIGRTPGDGGASGDGGRGSGGSTSSDGGAGNVGSTTGPTGTTGVTSGSTTSSTSASSTSSSTTSSATTSAGVTTSATTSAAATTSASTGGGGEVCDPLNPAVECGASQHCLPVEQGSVPECTPAGSAQHYGACLDNAECTAIAECIDVGDPFALPCCLQYCRNSGDCGGLDDCYFFDPPLFADGVQFGVCYDGSGYGCL